MQVLVDDILSLSKLSNTEVLKEKVDLNNVVSSILDDLEIAIEDKKAR